MKRYAPEKMPNLPERIRNILSSMGLSAEFRTVPDGDPGGWGKYRFVRTDGSDPPYPILLFGHKTKSFQEAKRQVSNLFYCVALFSLRSGYHLFLKSASTSLPFALDNADACEQAGTALSAAGFASAGGKSRMMLAIRNAIRNIPTTAKIFNNRGLFSTHYLKSRLLDSDTANAEGLEGAWDGDAMATLGMLGWDDLEGSDGVYHSQSFPEATILVVERGPDFGLQRSAEKAAPSYRAVAELARTRWVILTDGTTWRLYTSRVSASTTSYFELSLEVRKEAVLRYLVAIFGAASYVKQDGKASIDVIFDDGRTYAQELEDNLEYRMLKPDGVFVDLVKGVLGYDGTRRYENEDMASAKATALKIMYRIWFLLYAESRDLLPAKDGRYAPLSLMSLRTGIDGMEVEPGADSCWERVLKLFRAVRNGSPEHNLPQYNGGLFRSDPKIDGIKMQNRHAVRALRGFMEREGEAIDYASLNVRHLGHIYETLMEFEVRQADRDLMLLEDRNGVREVESSAESTYTYRKNDLYIVPKADAISRKSSGSFYTPDEVVSFLVKRGLKLILQEREKKIPWDIKRYVRKKTEKTFHTCMDRLLDIQVLDPAMGSGHFLVEALNQLTRWATGVLDRHPDHPLLAEIEEDRKLVISEQKKKGIAINESLLTQDVLLKRRIMKRCIFGVDVNDLAVELAKVSLWLDSFAIGVPLTYLDHHIMKGDSTMGSWRSDIKDEENRSLDGWIEVTNRLGGDMTNVSRNADITIGQVQSSEESHNKFKESIGPHKAKLDIFCASRIDDAMLPKKAQKHPADYIRRFGRKELDVEMKRVLDRTSRLAKRHSFFHWELEMTDAFTDARYGLTDSRYGRTDTRYGFDLIVGNPPWDKAKASDDEFFTPYYLPFRSLPTKAKKIAKRQEILEKYKIKPKYDDYLLSFKEKSAFYRMYAMQGDGDRDMWQLLLERMLRLLSGEGVLSMLLPSQLLSNTGSIEMRRRILDCDIQQMYVFENRRKIFPIDSRYRFVLLTLRNTEGPDRYRPGIYATRPNLRQADGTKAEDEFRVGFYLHSLKSLETEEAEAEKFHTLTKEMIRRISPDTLQIPEAKESYLAVLAKMSDGSMLGTESDDGWSMALSRGFDKTNDSDLLKEGGRGWPVLEGKNIHQFNYGFSETMFTTSMSTGLKREKTKRVYRGQSREFYHSFRLVFRRVAGSTNMRSIIASIVPPQNFFIYTLNTIVLTRSESFESSNEYDKKITYLCGILNSMSFDFAARAKLVTDTTPIIKFLPIPAKIYVNEITELAAKLSVGTDEFEGFAESLRVENVPLTPPERIRATARLDALVAHAYGLKKEEYETILNSFKFSENPDLLETESADFNDNKILRQFYGEVRKLAPRYYDEIAGGQA